MHGEIWQYDEVEVHELEVIDEIEPHEHNLTLDMLVLYELVDEIDEIENALVYHDHYNDIDDEVVEVHVNIIVDVLIIIDYEVVDDDDIE
jgi:hypothetical protein